MKYRDESANLIDQSLDEEQTIEIPTPWVTHLHHIHPTQLLIHLVGFSATMSVLFLPCVPTTKTF